MFDASFPTWVNGALCEPGEGFVPVDDVGLLSGLGVFDGLIFEGGHRFFEELHLERFARGAQAIGIDWPLPWDPEFVLDEYCRALGERDAFIRLTATRGAPGRGPTVVVGAREISRPSAAGVRLQLIEASRPSGALAAVKSTSRIGYTLAREKARDADAYDALLVTSGGEVLEGTICNVFVVQARRLITPAIERGCLPGVVRALVLQEAEGLGLRAEERRVDLADLACADEVLITNTSCGVAGVVEVVGLGRGELLPGPVGPRTMSLAGAMRAREALDRARLK